MEETNKVRGFFSYKLKDSVTGEIIKEYNEENQIMYEVPRMYFELVSGLKTGGSKDTITTLKPEDFRLCSVAFGTKGYDYPNNVPKVIDPKEEGLYSMNKSGGVFDGTTYQCTWEKLTEHEKMLPPAVAGQPYPGCKIQTEGILKGTDTAPFADFNKAGMNNSSSLHSETGLDVVTTVKDGIVTFNFSMLEKTGNGLEFSEAALFVRHKQDPGFSTVAPLDVNKYPTKTPGVPSLGTIFSKKTFEPVKKTNACVLELSWEINFNF